MTLYTDIQQLKEDIQHKEQEINELKNEYYKNILADWKQYEKQYVFCISTNSSANPNWAGCYGYIDNIDICDIGRIYIRLLHSFKIYNFTISDNNHHLEETFISPVTIYELPEDIKLNIISYKEYSDKLNKALEEIKNMYIKIN